MTSDNEGYTDRPLFNDGLESVQKSALVKKISIRKDYVNGLGLKVLEEFER